MRDEGPIVAYNNFEQFFPKCFSDKDLSLVLRFENSLSFNGRQHARRPGSLCERLCCFQRKVKPEIMQCPVTLAAWRAVENKRKKSPQWQGI
jgi:hypothetical protein